MPSHTSLDKAQSYRLSVFLQLFVFVIFTSEITFHSVRLDNFIPRDFTFSFRKIHSSLEKDYMLLIRSVYLFDAHKKIPSTFKKVHPISNINDDVPLRLFIKSLQTCNCHDYGCRFLCLATRFLLPSHMEQTH